MNQYGENGNIARNIDCPDYRNEQQILVKILTMLVFINGEPADQEGWQRACHGAPHSFGAALLLGLNHVT